MAVVTFVHDGDAIDYTPTADVAAGAVVVQGELVGVAKLAITANKLGSLAVKGVTVPIARYLACWRVQVPRALASDQRPVRVGSV